MSNTNSQEKREEKIARLQEFAGTGILVCQKVLGEEVDRIKLFPRLSRTVEGVSSFARESFRIYLQERTVIATHRDQYGKIEANILQKLSDAGAPVPQFIAFQDGWLVQEDIGSEQLYKLAQKTDIETARHWLEKGLISLAKIQLIAKEQGINKYVEELGPIPPKRREYHTSLVTTPERIAELLGLTLPEWDSQSLVDLIESLPWCFCKWDAHPVNGAVTDNNVAWFDWITFGGRSPLDDIAWLFCNDCVPYWSDWEEQIINQYLSQFTKQNSTEAKDYLYSFGTLLLSRRIHSNLTKSYDEIWHDRYENFDKHLRKKAIHNLENLLPRTIGWSRLNSYTAPLTPFLDKVAAHIAEVKESLNIT